MIAQRIISQYAKALVNLATSHEQLEKNLAEFQSIVDFTETHASLKQLLIDPSLSKEKKKEILSRLLSGRIDLFILNFLFILIDRRKINELKAIGDYYQMLAKAKLQILTVQVTTVVPLDEKSRETLINQLSHLYRKKVELIENLDPQILGGMVLTFNNQMIDDSVKTQLDSLKKDLLQVHI